MHSRAIKWETFAPTPDGLRVYDTVSGTSQGPNFELVHADVVETESDVTVWLSESVPEEGLEPQMALGQCVELRLRMPLGHRKVRDGTTAREKPQHDAAQDDPSQHCHGWRDRRPKKRRRF